MELAALAARMEKMEIAGTISVKLAIPRFGIRTLKIQVAAPVPQSRLSLGMLA